MLVRFETPNLPDVLSLRLRPTHYDIVNIKNMVLECVRIVLGMLRHLAIILRFSTFGVSVASTVVYHKIDQSIQSQKYTITNLLVLAHCYSGCLDCFSKLLQRVLQAGAVKIELRT